MISNYKSFTEFSKELSLCKFEAAPNGKRLIDQEKQIEIKAREVLHTFYALWSKETEPPNVEPEIKKFIMNLQHQVGLPYHIEERLKKNLEAASSQLFSGRDRSFELKEADIEDDTYPPQYETLVIDSHEIGFAHYIGRRNRMEDKSLASPISILINNKEYQCLLLGLFDGHGGDYVAEKLKQDLPSLLENTFKEIKIEGFSDDAILFYGLKKCFVSFTEKYQEDPVFFAAGSTANIALLFKKQLWIANIGDSRALLFNGEKNHQLSEDARPAIKRYAERIEKIGALIVRNRVNGGLGVSRALGDFEYITQLGFYHVPFKPKITKFDLETVKNGMLVLACDGFFEQLTSDRILKALQSHYELSPQILAKNLLDSIVHEELSNDNLSVIVMKINQSL